MDLKTDALLRQDDRPDIFPAAALCPATEILTKLRPFFQFIRYKTWGSFSFPVFSSLWSEG